jgi:SAM-dependent methyltransferase
MTDTHVEQPRAGGDVAMQLRLMLSGYRVSQAVHVAALLGVSDLLKDEPQSSQYLAERTGTDEDAIYRLMRGLSGVGLFTEVSPRQFALAPLGSLLRTDVEGSLHSLAVMLGQEWMWRPWGRLRESIETGEPVFAQVFEMSFLEYIQRNAEVKTVLWKAMAGAADRAAVADIYNFSNAKTVVDVGGGQGALIAAILAKYPEVHGILFERGSLLPAAKGVLESAGVLDRCELVEGDFFEAIRGGADTYILSQVLHDWSDKAAAKILATCRQAMPPDGKLLIVERVAPDWPGQEDAMLDLNILLLMGGRERTQTEYDALLAKAGFRTSQVLKMGETWRLIEAVAAPED